MKFRPTPAEIQQQIAPSFSSQARMETIEWGMESLRLFRELDDKLTAAQIDFFFHVARKEGCCIAEIAISAGIKQTTASHYFLKLSIYQHRGRSGLGLLHSKRNPFNQRQRLILLTSLGESLLNRLDRGIAGRGESRIGDPAYRPSDFCDIFISTSSTPSHRGQR